MAKKKQSSTTTSKEKSPIKKGQTISKGDERKKKENKKVNEESEENDISDQEIEQEEGSEEDNSENSENNENSEESESDNDSNENSDEEESSSSITPIKPENYAVKQMTFRERRGTKMNALMARKKDEEEDPFWAEHKGLFGDINGSDDEDEEDYVQSSSGKDQFDSDFGDTESNHDGDGEEEGKKDDEMDEDQLKEKKKKAELMKKINAYKEKPEKTKVEPKTNPKTEVNKKKQKVEPKEQEEVGNRYIHQVFNQELLLGEAAHTEYYNWLSLKKLISIETEKKDFTKKDRHIEGDKIVYRDRLNESGNRDVSYELCGIEIEKISDLTHYWQSK